MLVPFVFISLLPLAASLGAGKGDEPVAQFGEVPVTEHEFEAWLLPRRGPVIAEAYTRSVAIEAEAERQGIEISDEEVERAVNAPIEQRVTEAFGGSREMWLDELQRLQRSEAGLLAERRISARLELQFKSLVAKNRKLPEGYLESEWERRYGPGGWTPQLSVMQFRTPRRRGDSRDRLRELNDVARERALEAKKRIAAGEDFASVARALSDHDESRDQGGATAPDFSIASWREESRAAIAALAVGEISAPLTGPDGVWLVQVESRTENPFESVAETLREELLNSPPTAREYAAYVDEVVAQTDVELFPALLEVGEATDKSYFTEPVMRVGERLITRDEYGDYLRHTVGETSIRRMLVTRETHRLAAEAGFTISEDDVSQRIEDDIQREVDFGHNGKREEWIAEVQQTGRDEDLYRHEARLRARTTLLAEQLIVRDRVISEPEIRQAWTEKYGADGLAIELRMLVLRPEAPADLDPTLDPTEVQKMIDEADARNFEFAGELRERYEDGEDFAALVRQFSTDPETRELGGILPERFVPHEWEDEIAKAVNSCKIGELTPPLRIGPTWTLFEAIDRVHTPYESVRKKLKQELQLARPTQPEIAIFRNLVVRGIPVTVLPAMFD